MNDLAILQQQFKPLEPRLEAALGPAARTLPLPRLLQTIWVSIERNPKLLEANRQSLMNAALTFAFLGLEVDGATGQGFLLPFKNRVQPVIGYKGYATLGARSGLTINGDVVREGDDFSFELGSTPYIHHRPKLTGIDRKIVAAWATAAALDRPPIVAVMGIDELFHVKQRAPAGRTSDSPWNDPAIGFPAMCAKTVKRRLARGMPLNVMQYASRLEEAFEEQGLTGHIDPTQGVIIDPEPQEPPTATMLTQKPAPVETERVQASTEPADAPATASGDISGNLGRFRIACSSASEQGTKELERVWRTIPFEFRASLQPTFDRTWWPKALMADRRLSETEEGKLI